VGAGHKRGKEGITLESFVWNLKAFEKDHGHEGGGQKNEGARRVRKKGGDSERE